MRCPVRTKHHRARRDPDAAETPIEDALQEKLINWGYAVCDAALRRYFLPSLPRPTQFPLPGGVG